MDKDRQIRFLYPPLIFLASLALGMYFDSSGELRKIISEFIKTEINANIAIAIIGLSSIVLLLGFLLGTLTVLFLRLGFFWNRFNYEFKLKQLSYNQIGKLILKEPNTDSISKKDRMYAGIVFDHSYISEKMHSWVVRRWNSFFIASSSTVALFASLIIGHLLKIGYTSNWVWSIIASIFVFVLQAFSSWTETMRMIEFLIRVKKDNKEDSTSTDDKTSANIAMNATVP